MNSKNRNDLTGKENMENAINQEYQGASAEAIQFHYDVSNEFYQLWLDDTATYSSALWDNCDTLEEAQIRKMDYHIAGANAQEAKLVLDIGCGWGGNLRRLVDHHSVEKVIGITLSQAQRDWICDWGYPQIDVRVEGWSEHKTETPYDAILSIGSFEHFAHKKLSSPEKVKAYREFFLFCHQTLKPGGQVSLQTIIYENADEKDINAFMNEEIFPDSSLPHLSEIVQASEKLFEIITLRNDREHYVRTLRCWLKNLRANRLKAVELVGEEKVAAYEKYLSLSMIGFHSANLNLTRICFKRIDNPR